MDDLSSLNQDLISTMMMEKYDSVRECLEKNQMDKPQKYPSLAKFGDGNDIGRRSFKRKDVSLIYFQIIDSHIQASTYFFLFEFLMIYFKT